MGWLLRNLSRGAGDGKRTHVGLEALYLKFNLLRKPNQPACDLCVNAPAASVHLKALGFDHLHLTVFNQRGYFPHGLANPHHH